MSWLSKKIDKYIAKMVKKKGTIGAIIYVLELIAKATPSKADDVIVAKVKEFVKGL